MATHLASVYLCAQLGDATLTSTESSSDTKALRASYDNQTGGKNGNYIDIPKCSAEQYYHDHHITIRANDGSWIITFWTNDKENDWPYFNVVDSYSGCGCIPMPDFDACYGGSKMMLIIDAYGKDRSGNWNFTLTAKWVS